MKKLPEPLPLWVLNVRSLLLVSFSMAVDDFIQTLDSDDEAPVASSSQPKKAAKGAGKQALMTEDDAAFNPEFTFDLGGDPYDEILNTHSRAEDLVKGSKSVFACVRTVSK